MQNSSVPIPDEANVALYRVPDVPELPYTKALWVGEKIRTALLSLSGEMLGPNKIPTAFFGRDPDGKRLLGGHRHIYILSIPGLSSTQSGIPLISHIAVYSRLGYSILELSILDRLKAFWFDKIHTYRLNPEGLYSLEDVATHIGECACNPFGVSNKWASLTPYLLSRYLHIKRSEKHDGQSKRSAIRRELTNQLIAEAANHAIPEPSEISVLTDDHIHVREKRIRTYSFMRTKLKGPEDNPGDMPHNILMQYETEIRGPISLGYASHYGMGLFMPEYDKNIR